MNTGRSDVKEILFKKDAKVDGLVCDFPFQFRDYLVSIAMISHSATKVFFQNVPMYVSDMELMNLCSIYGKVEGGIQRERISLKTASGLVTVPSFSRFAMFCLGPEKSFFNYYWLDGPLPGDAGRRITVLHMVNLKNVLMV